MEEAAGGLEKWRKLTDMIPFGFKRLLIYQSIEIPTKITSKKKICWLFNIFLLYIARVRYWLMMLSNTAIQNTFDSVKKRCWVVHQVFNAFVPPSSAAFSSDLSTLSSSLQKLSWNLSYQATAKTAISGSEILIARFYEIYPLCCL